MSIELQKQKLMELNPGLMQKERKEQEDLPKLADAEDGKVVTRFAPSPTGPLNIGQFLRAAFLSHAYAVKYKGKFILRIEDTDAKNIEPAAYDWIREDLASMGIKPDQTVIQSDRMEIYYRYAEDLISRGKAYVCTCNSEKFKDFKLRKEDCPCRSRDSREGWNSMKAGEYEEGSAVLRLKLGMQDPNPVMRDPPVMRINKANHPRQGDKYKIWPLYNFSCVIDDVDLGITHVFRGKEHEHNTEIQKRIAEIFGWRFPVVVNFGMIKYPEEMLHTRDMKSGISEGKFSGWDDPRLPTVRALLRRGYDPDGLKSYALSVGLSKTDITLDWNNLNTHNRRVIDLKANRYMVVLDPVRIGVENAPAIQEIFEPLHPDDPKRGKKKMYVKSSMIFVSSEDLKAYEGQEIRLKGLYNFRMARKPKYIGNQVSREIAKIQWVSEPHVNVDVVYPGEVRHAFGEIELASAKVGDIIQMERVGFGRIDSKDKTGIKIYFAHK